MPVPLPHCGQYIFTLWFFFWDLCSFGLSADLLLSVNLATKTSLDLCPVRSILPLLTINTVNVFVRNPFIRDLKGQQQFGSVQYGTVRVRWVQRSNWARSRLRISRDMQLADPACFTHTHGQKTELHFCIRLSGRFTHAAGSPLPKTRTCGHHHLIFQPPKRGCWGEKERSERETQGEKYDGCVTVCVFIVSSRRPLRHACKREEWGI